MATRFAAAGSAPGPWARPSAAKRRPGRLSFWCCNRHETVPVSPAMPRSPSSGTARAAASRHARTRRIPLRRRTPSPTRRTWLREGGPERHRRRRHPGRGAGSAAPRRLTPRLPRPFAELAPRRGGYRGGVPHRALMREPPFCSVPGMSGAVGCGCDRALLLDPQVTEQTSASSEVIRSAPRSASPPYPACPPGRCRPGPASLLRTRSDRSNTL